MYICGGDCGNYNLPKNIENFVFKSFLTLSTYVTFSADCKMWTDKLGSAEVEQHVIWTVP
jgi:hypothetical protein